MSSHLSSEYRNRVEPGMKLLPWWYVGSRVVTMIRPGVLTVSSYRIAPTSVREPVSSGLRTLYLPSQVGH